MTLGTPVLGDGVGADLGITALGDSTILGIILATDGVGTDLITVDGTEEEDGTVITTIITTIRDRYIIVVQDGREVHTMVRDTHQAGVMPPMDEATPL